MTERDNQTKAIEDKRQNGRRPVGANIRFREPGGASLGARIVDLSSTGSRIESYSCPSVGSRILLSVPGLQILTAIVRYRTKNQMGCEFLQPLHPSIAAHLQARLAINPTA